MPKRSSRAEPRPAREQARDVYRGAILDAAEHEFAASGFHGAHMQEIAKRAGLAVGTIYNHFGQKEDVLAALLEQRVSELIGLLAPAEGDPRGYEASLVARFERVLAFRGRHAPFLTLAAELGLLGEVTSAGRRLLGDRSVVHTRRLHAMWRDLAADGVEAGALAPLDPELLAALLKSTFRAIARWSYEHAPESSPAEIAQQVVTAFLHGQGARPAPRRRARA